MRPSSDGSRREEIKRRTRRRVYNSPYRPTTSLLERRVLIAEIVNDYTYVVKTRIVLSVVAIVNTDGS